ncbi:MAG: prepilin peptidase [Verrucomicrobiales bacterium]|nr:prepilin peptidase [Verrucomicrobiales bacterium]MCP5525218.1 prepilin peptidase [Verrucomicrobiales bacterium]
MFEAERWAAVPFHFWTVAWFGLGCAVGSFLNVCIHRMPRDESIVSPPSHCPACGSRIPWYLNVPVLSWVWLRGRCAVCGTSISARYLGVELLTGALFMGAWLTAGERSALLALAFAVFLAGLVVATFIDFEHFIIPDEITLGGAGAGFVFSFLVPALHDAASPVASLQRCFLGAGLGWGLMYGVLRLGKMLFGRERLRLEPGTKVHFGEESLRLPGREVAYDELLYRDQDAIVFQARTLELVDRGYRDVQVRLSRNALEIGDETFDPEAVPFLEAVTDGLTLPREAMGLGDVKFMLAIGAFLGWAGVLFTLVASATVGSVVGIGAILLGQREWSSRIPYGPYLAAAAALWVFAGDFLRRVWLGG